MAGAADKLTANAVLALGCRAVEEAEEPLAECRVELAARANSGAFPRAEELYSRWLRLPVNFLWDEEGSIVDPYATTRRSSCISEALSTKGPGGDMALRRLRHSFFPSRTATSSGDVVSSHQKKCPAESLRNGGAKYAVVGGGSLPGYSVPSAELVVPITSPGRAAAQLRMGQPPVFCRMEDGALVFDLRTVPPASDDRLARAIRYVLEQA